MKVMGIRVVVILPFTVVSLGCVRTAAHAYLEASVNSVYGIAGSVVLLGLGKTVLVELQVPF